MKWEIKYHDEKLQAEVLALPPGILARYFHCTDRMIEFGPDLGMPHTRAMSSGLFELRLKSREGIGRCFTARWWIARSSCFINLSKRLTRHRLKNWH
jgi:hypothetical protein